MPSNLRDNEPIIQFLLPPLPDHHICFYGANPVTIQRQKENEGLHMKSSALVRPNSKMLTLKLARTTFIIKVSFQSGALYRITAYPQ
jgi:hypothetical protein